jgi:type III restriction enzyme
MKFKFSKDLDYQLDAINAVVGLFEGVKHTKQKDTAILRSPIALVANELEFDTDLVLANLRAIQKQNNIEQTTALDSANFSVEMETGTGKTYVYLRTIFELNAKYGLTKFIILVPSVAIREGVLKTIEQTRQHFKELYDNVIFGSFAYDSTKLRQVRDFIQSPEVQIMIMTTQSFTADTAVMRQTDRDDTYGEESYIKMVAQTRPVVIMDEPQNMEGPATKDALKLLEPLVQLRYSATHREVHNLVYRLTPVDAYTKGLVKKVEVWGATIASAGEFVFKVLKVITKKGEAPTAQVQLEVKTASGEYEVREVKLKDGDDLYIKSKKNQKYEGLYVGEINARDGVELSNGKLFGVEGDDVVSRDEIFRTQIRETIKAHMRKQQDLGKRIKVLSLFFIDKVENYRGENAIIKKIFEEEFNALKARSEYFKDVDVGTVHDGYFSQDRKSEGRKSVEVSSETKCERLTYDLIMKDKEKLLSFEEPLAFIFSHSALKEGWDNPNIFQICTLIQTKDDFTKRQKIGRGLRLPVDVEGNRIYDPKVNVLTVVANESYETFARTLQDEYDAAGYTGKARIGNAKERVTVTFKKALIDEEFKKLWNKISEKTVYNVALDSSSLIQNAIAKIDETISQNNLAVVVEKVQLEVNKEGVVRTVYQGRTVGESIEQVYTIENIVDRIARETMLTRKTILSILEGVAAIDLVQKNPEAYVRSVIAIINGCKQDLIVNEGVQYVPTGDYWKMELFEDFESYANKTIPSEKSVYSHVAFDSEGEELFARNLETRNDVKVFAKLPSWFKIDTPLGGYNPDWAIVIGEEGGDVLYLVRETKFVEDIGNLRPSETQKIALGKKHFQAIGFNNFDVATKEDLNDLI